MLILKRIKKYKKYIQSLDDIPKYVQMKNREINLDIITPQVAAQIDQLIRFWNYCDEEKYESITSRVPIKIFINSLGGDLNSAILIMDSIRLSKTPVYTININCVYNESFLIYLAGHKRYAYENSLFMFTETMFYKIMDKIDNESNFYPKSAVFEQLRQKSKEFILERMSITESQYDKHCKNELWMNAEDGFKLHLVNEIKSLSHIYM